MKNFQTNLFEPCTTIPCNINEVGLRDFLKICRAEYLKAHNIEDKTFFKKEIKTMENEVYEKIRTAALSNKNTTKCVLLNTIRYRSYFNGYTRNVINIACALYGKPEKEMNVQELKETLEIMKKLYQYTTSQFQQNQISPILSWENEKENIDMEKTINVKSIRSYIEKYFTQEGKTKPERTTFVKITHWIKFTQPVKTLEFPVKGKPSRFREYYSKEMVNNALEALIHIKNIKKDNQ